MWIEIPCDCGKSFKYYKKKKQKRLPFFCNACKKLRIKRSVSKAEREFKLRQEKNKSKLRRIIHPCQWQDMSPEKIWELELVKLKDI